MPAEYPDSGASPTLDPWIYVLRAEIPRVPVWGSNEHLVVASRQAFIWEFETLFQAPETIRVSSQVLHRNCSARN